MTAPLRLVAAVLTAVVMLAGCGDVRIVTPDGTRDSYTSRQEKYGA